MLTCKEANFLASKRLDNKLTFRENLNFRLHIMMCGLCRRYAKELEKLQNIMQNASQSGLSLLPESMKLSNKSRNRIKQAMDIALHHNNK